MKIKNKKINKNKNYIIGLLGIKYPIGYRHKVTEYERREVEWLIKEGDFDSIEEYEDFCTKQELGLLNK